MVLCIEMNCFIMKFFYSDLGNAEITLNIAPFFFSVQSVSHKMCPKDQFMISCFDTKLRFKQTWLH